MTHRQAQQLAHEVHARTGRLACAVRVIDSDYVVHVELSAGLNLRVRDYADLARLEPSILGTPATS